MGVVGLGRGLPPLALIAPPLADTMSSFLGASTSSPLSASPLSAGEGGAASGGASSASEATAAARAAMDAYNSRGGERSGVEGAPDAPVLRLVDVVPSWFTTLQGEVIVLAALAAIVTGDVDPTTWSGDLDRSVHREEILKAVAAGGLGVVVALEVAHLPVLNLLVEPVLRVAGLTGLALAASVVASDEQWEETLREPIKRVFNNVVLGERVTTAAERAAEVEAARQRLVEAAAAERAETERRLAEESAEATAAVARAQAISAQLAAEEAEADTEAEEAAPEKGGAEEVATEETAAAESADAEAKVEVQAEDKES